jgi:hypothetical protein
MAGFGGNVVMRRTARSWRLWGHGKSCPVPEDRFRDVLERYAAHFPYATFKQATASDAGVPLPSPDSLVRFLPSKPRWTLGELLAFDGADFPWAVARALGGRTPTASELSRAIDATPIEKVSLILDLHAANRLTREVDVVGVRTISIVHSLLRRLPASKIPLVVQVAKQCHARLGHHIAGKAAPLASTQQLLYRCLHELAVQRDSTAAATVPSNSPATMSAPAGQDRRRIVICNFYPVWPPMGGGQRRIFF